MIQTSECGYCSARPVARGFTLMELAISLVIVTLFLAAIMVPLQTQVEQRRISDTQRTLEDIKEALIGFAVSNGRLPCPAAPAATGTESPLNGGVCNNAWNGFVPAATLGIGPTDAQGYAIDAWGTRIHYAVTTANGSAFTTTNTMRAIGMGALSPDLWVCPTSTGITATDCGGGNPYLTNSAVAVIYSLGPNWLTGGVLATNRDEFANPNLNGANNDQVFVYHTRTTRNAPNGEFDDVVTWLSPGVLYSRMVNAGRLP